MSDAQQQIRRQLTGPGGPFELTLEEVSGEKLWVFKTRQGSLRELLAEIRICFPASFSRTTTSIEVLDPTSNTVGYRPTV